MPDRRKIEFVSVTISEDLRVEANGMQSLIGVLGNNLPALQLPVAFHKLVFRVEFECQTAFVEECGLKFEGPTGKESLHHQAPFGIVAGLRNVFAVGWGPVALKEYGEYKVLFNIGKEKPRLIARLLVSKPEVAQMGGQQTSAT